MGYLNELLARNPLVIDGDTIRPHHKYTDDLYTGGKTKMTNYDRIKSMSVEEMAGLIVDFHFVFQCKSYGLDPKTVYENMSEEDKKKNKEWEEEMRPIWKRWLLQEVSDENITKIEHNSLCETETYKAVNNNGNSTRL